MNKRILLKNIRKRWDTPEKLLDYLIELDKQQEIDLELVYKKGMKETIKNYSIAMAYTLNYKFGFGKKRLGKLLSDVIDTCNCFETGHLSIEDCIQELNKIGVNIL